MGKVLDYFKELAALPIETDVTDFHGNRIPFESSILSLGHLIKTTSKTMICGNGGSASIASHCASHFPNAGGIRMLALNDISALTAAANDFGYENVYARQIDVNADLGDLLIAISSSGNSYNIVNAIKKARDRKCKIVTLSGFGPNNKIRFMGDMNFYVPSLKYGFVELTHMAILHAAFDLMEIK